MTTMPTLLTVLTTHRAAPVAQPAYAPPHIPIRRFALGQDAIPPRAWWLFAAGFVFGWLLHALTH